MLDSLKPLQFGFFGSRGLFPKKVLESGCGVKPRIYIPHCRGMGRSPIYDSLMSGRGARSPAMLHTDYLALGAVAEGHIRVGNVLVALDVHFFSFAVSGDGELQRVAYAVSLDCFFDIGR